jgi:hypothetical protein
MSTWVRRGGRRSSIYSVLHTRSVHVLVIKGAFGLGEGRVLTTKIPRLKRQQRMSFLGRVIS